MSLRWLCFGILLTAAVCRLLSEGSILPAAAAPEQEMTLATSYPALPYDLPEVLRLYFEPEDALVIFLSKPK